MGLIIRGFMGERRRGKVIPITSSLRQRLKARESGREGDFEIGPEDAFVYTMDLLMEDFGKKHLSKYCALCEPMKVLGQHRDEVMVELLVVLFTTFFPTFHGYLLEVRDNLVQGLLGRRERRTFDSLKEKLHTLLEEQIEADLKDFFTDLRKHLLKYASVELEGEKELQVLGQVFVRLRQDWMGTTES